MSYSLSFSSFHHCLVDCVQLPPQMGHQMGAVPMMAPQPVMYNQPVLRPTNPFAPIPGTQVIHVHYTHSIKGPLFDQRARFTEIYPFVTSQCESVQLIGELYQLICPSCISVDTPTL